MAVNKNPNETGWFYHAPSRKRNEEKLEAPAPSQIPGIGFDDPEFSEKEAVREMVFKDTDSKYIRMAKMGGRKDLLTFNPELYSKKPPSVPRGYARSDWYYLEDNRMEEEEKKAAEAKEWEFLLPEYMVHQGYKPSFSNPSTPTRSAAPYHMENTSVMEREGRSATDKTIKIPEVRRPGYGVRNEKPPMAMHKNPPREKACKPPESELMRGERRIRSKMNVPNERDDPTNMTKLLANTYEKEWHEELAKTEVKMTRPDRLKGQENMDPVCGSGKRRGPEDKDSQMSAIMRGQKVTEEEKELFKMSRFRNIPSKIDSHQKPEIMAAVK